MDQFERIVRRPYFEGDSPAVDRDREREESATALLRNCEASEFVDIDVVPKLQPDAARNRRSDRDVADTFGAEQLLPLRELSVPRTFVECAGDRNLIRARRRLE
jgi:hypothetical protein